MRPSVTEWQMICANPVHFIPWNGGDCTAEAARDGRQVIVKLPSGATATLLLPVALSCSDFDGLVSAISSYRQHPVTSRSPSP
jgi:hypothetical protein